LIYKISKFKQLKLNILTSTQKIKIKFKQIKNE
jgi:hypothetical protein